ncbi:unnamed protein product [Mytilus edulis]|uniref:Peptidase A2 domain-containing protein n=1 Tax=Mytilus edulis TaxID=6550 RepID=A0A8S3UG45_MYTED|nr:unnamed protein product [Mytilus edulis]
MNSVSVQSYPGQGSTTQFAQGNPRGSGLRTDVQHFQSDCVDNLDFNDTIKINSIIPDNVQGIKIRGKVFMRDATLLIDTGAVVSLVNKNMVPNIELLNVKPNYKHIVSATGQPLNITGILECEISVNSEVSVHNMYVVENLLYDAIIGTDIMKRIGIVIDMKDEAAYWNNMYVKFIGSSDQNSVASSSLYGVNLIQTVYIPARSEMICFGRVNGDVNGMIGIIEPKSQLTSKYSVIPARVLTKVCDKDVVFKVLNPTTKTVKLFKDTNIGTFEEIDELSDEEPLPEDPYTTFSLILYSDVSDNEILIDEEEHLDNLDKTFCDISNDFQLVEDSANKSEDKEDNTGDDIISISDTFGDMNSSSHVIIDETIITIIID